jgi:hypothetical protein
LHIFVFEGRRLPNWRAPTRRRHRPWRCARPPPSPSCVSGDWLPRSCGSGGCSGECLVSPLWDIRFAGVREARTFVLRRDRTFPVTTKNNERARSGAPVSRGCLIWTRPQAGHPIDGALTVAHAVWHFAGVPLRGRPKKRALARSLCDTGGVRWRKGWLSSERSHCGPDPTSLRAVVRRWDWRA